ncbi:MAG: type IV secretion system protein VirB10 [Proteobacteria bacterium]|nr:type IV secretion system protein VirB10 [Pseudomonadota bacterium]
MAGERAAALVGVARSLQSRLSSVMAAALMIALGVGGLTWYYAHAFAHSGQTQRAAQAAVAARAQGEMSLPSLGRIDPPAVVATAAAAQPGPSLTPTGGEQGEVPLTENPATPSAAAPLSAGGIGGGPIPQVQGVGEPHGDRRLAGDVFARESRAVAAQGSAGLGAEGAAAAAVAGAGGNDPRATGAPAGELAALLRTDPPSLVRARRLPDRHLLLPQGAFLDCTLETAIDSTLPGMTTCLTAADTFGADGSVVLLERGTRLVGETRGQVRQGQARVFVVWTQARTPGGVVVPLDSPGTDELGRSGLAGEVQRHFWQRFGAALLISTIDGAVQAGVQAAARPGGTVVYTPSGSQEIVGEVLKETVRIPPTVVKKNGERIQVLVAHDVDFRDVYELRAATASGH